MNDFEREPRGICPFVGVSLDVVPGSLLTPSFELPRLLHFSHMLALKFQPLAAYSNSPRGQTSANSKYTKLNKAMHIRKTKIKQGSTFASFSFSI